MPQHIIHKTGATGADIAWAAGLYEGEGSLYPRPRGLCLTLGSTDMDVLEKLQRALGFGTIYTTKIRPGRKPYWVWRVSSHQHVQAAVALFWGRLCRRRRAKAEEMLAAANKRRPRSRASATHCAHGHLRTTENTYITSQHRLRCRECQRDSTRRFRAKNLPPPTT